MSLYSFQQIVYSIFIRPEVKKICQRSKGKYFIFPSLNLVSLSTIYRDEIVNFVKPFKIKPLTSDIWVMFLFIMRPVNKNGKMLTIKLRRKTW